MHRQTPLTQGFVGYTGGGARALIHEIDDGKMMQQMKGSMLGEGRDGVESPQNYGFSSVVRPASKDKDGNVTDCAEGFMSYFGGSRTSNFCAVMDDRRYRPMGLKPGENSQYDDLGQMTLLRRTGLYLLSNDNQEDNQQGGGGSSGGGGGGASARDDSGGGSNGGGQQTERFVSVRHVEKKKQDRPQRGGGGNGGGGGGGDGGGGGASTRADAGSGSSQSSGQSAQDFKHEGETVNLEMRVSKKRIEFRSGDDVVGYYEKESKKWVFVGELHLGSEDADHPVYGVNGGVGMTTETSGDGAVLVKAPKPGPPTSLDGEPFDARDTKIAALEARVAALESGPQHA